MIHRKGHFDLSEHILGRACGEIRAKIGEGSGFREPLFERDPKEKGNAMKIPAGYFLRVEDEGSVIKVILTGRDAPRLAEKLGTLNVDPNYKDFVSSVYVNGRGPEVVIGVRFKPRDNASGRIQDKDRVYFAVSNCAIKPAVNAAYRLEKE